MRRERPTAVKKMALRDSRRRPIMAMAPHHFFPFFFFFFLPPDSSSLSGSSSSNTVGFTTRVPPVVRNKHLETQSRRGAHLTQTTCQPGRSSTGLRLERQSPWRGLRSWPLWMATTVVGSDQVKKGDSQVHRHDGTDHPDKFTAVTDRGTQTEGRLTAAGFSAFFSGATGCPVYGDSDGTLTRNLRCISV